MITQPKRNIFDINDELDQVAEAFDALNDGGTEEAVLEAIEKYFGDLLDERDKKLENYARFIRQREFMADVRKEEAKRVAALAKTDENAIGRCKSFLKLLFDQHGWTKIETPLFKFGVQKNGGKAPLEIDPDVDPNTVNGKYQRVVVTLDTEAIRADLEAGVEIPFARIGEVGTHLRIR